MRISTNGNRSDKVLQNARNAEASTTIPRGTPVVLKFGATAATNDGLDVILPSSSSAALANSLLFGVTTNALIAGDIQEVISEGYVAYAVFTGITRAASTDSWTSTASVTQGALLCVDTLNNAWKVASASLGSNNFQGFAILLDSPASSAASASATSDTRTVVTSAIRCFVRML